jgi:hypothetical protein
VEAHLQDGKDRCRFIQSNFQPVVEGVFISQESLFKVHRVRLPVDSNTSVPLPYLQPFPYPVVYARPLPPVTYMRSEIPATYDSEEHRSATRRLSSPTPLERYSQCSAIKRVCTRVIGGCLSTVYPLYYTLSETGVSEKEHSGMWWAQAPSQG